MFLNYITILIVLYSMWYKYYFERCEEKQLLDRIKKDSHHSKLLPTMIALRMDWKFLEKAYFKDDEKIDK